MQGTVYHMISHFHLQHGKSGVKKTNANTDAKASDYAKQKVGLLSFFFSPLALSLLLEIHLLNI